MKLPKMKQPALSRSTLEVFGGYDHNLQIGEGSFYEMENMTSDYFPVLSPRAPRGKTAYGSAQALVSSHGLCRVSGGRFYLPDGTDAGISLTEGEKQLVAMGGFVVILPDKVWVNVAGEGARSGTIERNYSFTEGRFTFRPCKADGTVYTEISESRPEVPLEGQLWLDDTGAYPVLKQWEEATGQWLTMESGYVRVDMRGIGEMFDRGDSVTVKMQGIRLSDKDTLRFLGEVTESTESPESGPWGVLRGTWVIREKQQDFLVISGYLGVSKCTGSVGSAEDALPDGEVLLERKLPDMDLVVESGNRLWGCKYGSTENGFVNEIYASKLGDFKNWQCYQGISTDSYTASVGADGPFTGVVSYQGRPLFFKENCMIELSGSQPSNYQIRCTPCDGVAVGCEKSLAIVSNVLYYKSGVGVCAFDGSLPVQIGQPLGQIRYTRAVAGARGRKYYICMYDGDKSSLFVYDTARHLWHREDALEVDDFCSCGGTLYMNTAQGIFTTDQAETASSVPWMVQWGKLGMRLPESKFVTRMTLRLSMALGAEVSVYVSYDSGDVWEHLHTVRSQRLGSVSLPIRPKRCDHLRLKLEGVGDVKLYSLTKTIEKGSEG